MVDNCNDRTYLLKTDGASRDGALRDGVSRDGALRDGGNQRRQHKEASKTRKAIIIACCIVMQIVSNGLGFGLSVLYVEIQRVFDAPRTQAALVQSIFMGIMTAGGILYTPFIKRYGVGLCVGAGTVIGCAGFIASAFATELYTVIILIGGVGGIGISINYFAPFVTASLVFREKASVPLVFVTTGSSLGQFIFPTMYDMFISEYGWRGALMLVAAVSLHCVPAGLFVYTSRSYMASLEDDDGGGDEEGVVNETANQQRCCKSCDMTLLSDVTILLILSACVLLAGTGNAESWFLVDLMTIRGYERQTGALFVSFIGISNFVGRLTGVLIRFKVRIPTICNWVYTMPVLGLGHFLILYFVDYVPLLLSCLLYGYVFGITVAQTPAVMFEAAGLQRYANGMGMSNFCFGGGNFVGGFIGGVINDSYGNYDPFFYLAVASGLYMSLASTVVVLIMRRRKNQENKRLLQGIHGNAKYDSTGYSRITEDTC